MSVARRGDKVLTTVLSCAARLSELMLLEVLAMYEHELVAKSLIASDIFECSRHETVTMYLASWQMQPHIDRQRIEELVALIQNDQHYQTCRPPK